MFDRKTIWLLLFLLTVFGSSSTHAFLGKNCVGDFFSPGSETAGLNGPASRTGAGENPHYHYETASSNPEARYYNPLIRRFVNSDPARDAWNWFAYAGGNPVSFVDPTGFAANLANGGNTGVGDTGFGLRDGASLGVGALPLVGTGQSFVELITGQDYIAGEPTSRTLAAVGLFAGIFPGGKPAVKGGGKLVGKFFAKSVNKIPTPTIKNTPFGPKIADEIPTSGIPKNWNKSQIDDAITDYSSSIASRKAELKAFDLAGGGSATQRLAHARRITQEENFLKSLLKASEN